MYAQGIYHVAGHGSDDRVLFRDDEDRHTFLEHLATTFAELGLGLVSFVQMTNHHHLLVYTPDRRIAQGLHALHGGYARTHNRRHGRTAHLFRAHPLAAASKTMTTCFGPPATSPATPSVPAWSSTPSTGHGAALTPTPDSPPRT